LEGPKRLRAEAHDLVSDINKRLSRSFRKLAEARVEYYAFLYPPRRPVIFSKRHKDKRLKTGVHQASVSQRAKEIRN
jgi:hypothetical protein